MDDTTPPDRTHVDEDLRGSRYERVDLGGSTFERVHLTDVTLRSTELRRVRMRDVELEDVEIWGDLDGVRLNGVDVAPLVEAELDRRDPDRPLMRPTDADGFRRAWDTVERLWGGTVERAATLPPDRLHASVDGEWSFVQTLRHLAFATDAWVGRAVLGDPAPWHPLDLPWDGMEPTPGVPWDRDARPSLDEALALRLDRMATVRGVVDALTDDELDRRTDPHETPGWPPAGATYPVRTCLLVTLNEEYQHRLFAERDLTALAARTDG